MTYNMYVGTEYTGINTAPDYDAFMQAVSNAIDDVRTGDPAARAQAIAQQIAAAKPDLVSLQEVSTWSTGTFTATWTGTTSCDNLQLEFDYRQLLLDALTAQGAHYMPVATNTHFQVDAPTSAGTCVRNTWSIVVLARADLKPEDFSFSNVQTATFEHVLPIIGPGQSFGVSSTLTRGPRTSAAKALKDTVALCLVAEDLFRAVSQHTEIVSSICKYLVRMAKEDTR